MYVHAHSCNNHMQLTGILSIDGDRAPRHLTRAVFTGLYAGFFFFSREPHTKQKKIVRKSPHRSIVYTCIAEPYNATRLPIMQFCANRVKVVTYVCWTIFFLNNAHSRNAWAENIANAWLPCTNIWETLQRAITLILRCE